MNNLNPKFFTDEKLDPIVRERLLRIADKFYEFLKIKQPYEDIILTGSTAGYNWTSKSDVDLHLIFDYSKINENTELVKEYMWAHKVAWNDEHEIKIRKFPVELYAQDSKEAHYSMGMYSVLRDEWIKKPSKEAKPVKDEKAIEHKAKPIEYEIDAAIKELDYDKLVKIVEKLKVMRTVGLEKGGEYSLENQTFKHLRRNGYLEKLTDARNRALDETLTLERQMNETKSTIVKNILKEAQIIETIWKEFQEDEQILGKTKPDIFTHTTYRMPTDAELEDFKNYNLTAREIANGFGYTIIGRGIRDAANTKMIKEAIQALINKFPDNKTYSEALKLAN